jgi:hypothetical protein
MAFCNSCGTALTPGAQFCNKCGAVITPGSGAPAPTAAPVPTSTGGSSALKVILIVVAVIIGIGILGIVTVGVVGYHVAKRTHVRQEGGHVKVETPFGNVETSNDPDQVAKGLGVDIYPGAQVQKEGASIGTFGSVHTATANFITSDAVDKVCAFYRPRVVNPTVATSDQNRCTYVSNNDQNMITINVESDGADNTRIQITSVKKAN